MRDILLLCLLSCSGVFGGSRFISYLQSIARGRKLRDDLSIFEGDMVLQRSFINRAVTSDDIQNGETRAYGSDPEVPTSAMTKPLWQRWKNGVVPYDIHHELKCDPFCPFSNPEKIIRRAMDEWSRKTCVVFRPRLSTDRDVVVFKFSPRGLCAAEVGRVGGEQHVWLGSGCIRHGVLLHEIGHVLGFYHEQSRPDRDEYVKIHWKNIYKKNHKQFKKYKSYSDMGTPYDYDSIMHYRKNEFRIYSRWFQHSITPRKIWRKRLGQRRYVSKIDAEETNLYYECPKKN